MKDVKNGLSENTQSPDMRNDMRNGTGIATRVLLINSVISVFAFVAQVASLVVNGPSNRDNLWMLTLALVLIMFIASIVAQWVVRRSLFAGMNFFAWICYACIVGMVCVDVSILIIEFPLILFMLTLGVLGLGLTVGYLGSIPYSAICCITVFVAGVLSSDVDKAIIASALIAATAAMSSENAHTTKRLDILEQAIGAYVGAKREFRQDTAVDRRCES